MKIISFLFLFLLFSCTTAKFHTMDDAYDMTTRLKGKVKSMETTFISTMEDTIGMKNTRNFYFDKRNNLLKEQYSLGKYSDETIFNYNKDGLLKSSITKQNSPTRFTRSEYEYDKKKNCICIKNFGSDTLYTIKVSKYDQKNNVIEEELNNLKNEKNSWRATYSYDYKKRICLLKTYGADNIEKNSILEFHYDKKGNIINMNIINSKTKLNTYTSFDYDRFGNSISYLSIDEKKNTRISNIIKNEYDKIGNVVKKETFENFNLIEKSIMEITYW